MELTNPSLERAVLGCCLMNPDALDKVMSEGLHPSDFSEPPGRVVFSAINRLYQNGERDIDTLSIQATLEADKGVDYGYLHSLDIDLPDPNKVMIYLKGVKDLGLRRRLIKGASELSLLARNTETANEALSRAQYALSQMEGMESKEFSTFSDVVGTVSDHLDRPRNSMLGAPTGIVDLDHLTLGMLPGRLWLIGARPSMGKSAMALSMAMHAASKGKSIAMFSVEMTVEEIGMRAVSAMTGVSHDNLRKGHITQAQAQTIAKAVNDVSKWKIFTDDSGGVTVEDIINRSRKLKRNHGLDVIFVDYLQLVKPGNRYRGNKVNEVAEISRALKEATKELGVSVVALSQLNRALELRDNKRPMLSDLRDSGSLEQDSNIVLFLYRDELYHPSPDNAGITELIVAKHREGATGTLLAKFEPELIRFRSLTDRY
jgi:replicative DNA helicase